MSRRATRGAVLVVAALLAGCGVPEDDVPTALDPAQAPFQVFEPEPVPSLGGEVQVDLFLVQGSRLVPVPRRVEMPGTPQQLLDQLFSGATTRERDDGLSSAIPDAFELESVEVRNGIAVVTLGGVEEQVRTDSNVAFAQIVATLTGRPNVEGVRFRTEEGDLRVPRGDGSLTDAPVDRQAYAELLGLVAPPGPVAPAPAPAAGGAPAEQAPPPDGTAPAPG